MKTYITIISLITTLLMTVVSNAQQDPNYTFYRYNMNILNPAFAGSSEGSEFSLGLRSQWAGLEGAPESQSAIFSTPIGNGIGLGVSILNDRTFIESQTWLAIDVSYNIRLNNNNYLYFGIKGSTNSYNANTQGLLTYGIGQDGTLLDYEGRFTPNIGAGVYLKNDRYFLSFSVPRILTPERLQESQGDAFLGVDRMHTYVSGGYDFVIGKTVDFKTMALFRYVDASPASLELTGILDFSSRFELGASYRINESVGGLFFFKVGTNFNIGYAYETALQNSIDGLENGTHELFMKLSI